MLREKIQMDIKEAMKSRSVIRLDALRFVWSRIKEVEIDTKTPLADEEIQALVAREVKARKEAMGQFKEAGRDDLIVEEEKKLEVLMELLPQQMSSQEVEKVIEKILTQLENPTMGAVMGMVMQQVKGKADGTLVRELVSQRLS